MIDKNSLAGQPILETLTWKPLKFGDLIIGKCLLCNFAFKTSFVTKLHIRIAADEVISDGEKLLPDVYSVWEKAQLRAAVIQSKLCAGDNVGISYVEEMATNRGNAKKKFRIQVEKTPESEIFVAPAMNVNDAPADGDVYAESGQDSAENWDQYVKEAGAS